MKILLVDDQPGNRKLLTAQLEAEGFQTVEAVDGVEALARLQDDAFDLVITDILMPRMDGYRLCFEIRRDEALKHLPIIVYTSTYTSKADEKLSLELGANRFVRKPAAPSELIAAVRDGLTCRGASVAPPARPPELDLMKEYNARLVSKLEQKHGELTATLESLHTLDEQLRLRSAALASAGNGVVITNRAGAIVWVNPAFTDITGYSAADAVGKTPRILQSGRHDLAFYETLWQTVGNGRTWRGEFTNRRKDGKLFYTETTITPVTDPNGTITHFVGVFTDLTLRREEEEDLRTTHLQLRQLLQHSPVITYLLKVDGERVVPHLVSDNITRFLGFLPAEATSYDWWLEHLHPEDRERALASVRDTLTHDASTTEYRMHHRDGTYRWVCDERRAIRDAGGRPIELVGVWTDITERKRAEEMVRGETTRHAARIRAEMRWELAMVFGVAALVGIYLFTTNRLEGPIEHFIATNHLFDEVIGTGTILVLGLALFSIRRWRGTNHHLIQERNVQSALRTLHGELETRIQQRTDELARANAVLRSEVAEREKTEMARRESEVRFRHIAETIEEVFWMADAAITEMVYISPAYERVWGRSCQSLYTTPRSFVDAIVPEDRPRVLQEIDRRPLGQPFEHEYRICQPTGDVRWIWDRGFPVRNAAGETLHFVGVAEDITERRLAEQRMSLQHAVTAVLAESATVDQVNRKILATLGETLRWDVGELWLVDRRSGTLHCAESWHAPSDDFSQFILRSRERIGDHEHGLPAVVWAAGLPIVVTNVADDPRCVRREAAAAIGLRDWIGIPIKLHDETLGVIGFFSARPLRSEQAKLSMLAGFGVQLGHFMERQHLTEQFRQAQKMEAIGTLAGGIAHDFNNIIAAISGYSELARMEAQGNVPLQENLDAVLKASTRAAGLVRQILAFSRHQESERRPIQLRHVVNEALSLLRATIPATIEFEVSLARELPTVLADATQIHQVMMNLCTNASHAMGASGGTLGVVLEGCLVDEHMAESHRGLQPGPHVRLTVSDTGAGMDAAIVARVFEPFFTTKKPGEGTGLGLAVVHGIVLGHQGVVTVYSQPGVGTIFRVYLPATHEPAGELVGSAVETPRGTGERILFVDDERALAVMGQKILQRLGYHVDIHTSPAEAITAVRAKPDYYDLVVTDLAMPSMTGTELATQVLALQPSLPIILVTGYAPNLSPARAQSLGLQDLLLKPLSVSALGLAVRRALTQTLTR